MADAADLKSAEGFLLYGFESRLRHHWRSRIARDETEIQRLIFEAVSSIIHLVFHAIDF